ncbi:MAG: hypothetical protein II776_02000, partial [Clostridia bacterium]|nr:hypothetical protein [Clostridia bacterium]
SNGRFSETHGLPENFGGSVSARYAGGEKLSFSDNQSPVLTDPEGLAIRDFFRKALSGKLVDLPAPEKIREILFVEKRPDGGFTEACLTTPADGAAALRRRSRYKDPKIYEKTIAVPAETVEKIRRTVAETGLLGWRGLPDDGFSREEKTLAFTLDDGAVYTVRSGRVVPDALRRGFFDVELPLTTL